MSYVYFIGPVDWRYGCVKIGVTRSHPLTRLASFQTGSPIQLQLYGYFHGNVDVEQLFHRTFESLRQRGEWFDMRGKLLAAVSNIYGIAFGDRPLTDLEIDQILNDIVLSEEATECYPQGEWDDSAQTDEINAWLHDRAWAIYCEQNGRSQ